MGIKTFFRNFLDEKKTIEVNVGFDSEQQSAMIEAFALKTVISFIAQLLASCEYRTYNGGKPEKTYLWYKLNILPNRNQTKSEFWREFWERLLLFGEVLIVPWNDDLFIAENFTKDEYVVFGTTFRHVIRNDFDFGSYNTKDAFYIKRETCKDRAVVTGVLAGYSELVRSAAAGVLNEGANKGTLEVPAMAQNDKNFEQNFKALMEDYFRDFFKNKNAVLPLFSGMKYSPVTASQKSTSRASEYKALFDDAVKRAAQAYGVSPALISGDIAGIDEALKLTYTACIDPLAKAAGDMLTARNYAPEQIIDGQKYIKIDTAGLEHINVFALAANIDKLISDGMYSIDELRLKLGDYALGEEWSQKHFITKNYEEIETAGGEENA
jgi:HK97 family phage portal protein